MAVEQQTTEKYSAYLGDCLEVMPQLPEAKLHFSLYSPPFAGLYHYSSSERPTAETTRSSWSTTVS